MAAQDTQTSLLNTVVQQEMAVRRQRVGISRQDSRLSVKSLIESIEKSQQQVCKNVPTVSFYENIFLCRQNQMDPVHDAVQHQV